ncbi:hypothetical protein BWP24_27460 (plasmid) [Vibrio campbellii]|uniref:HEPN domain-containing protein n=1 Tax=Vibrio campbellii TaxID=680 RepID=UPI0009717658|nr:HEPN domain-containing protein [Vibrio campbellii]APX09945.1 hypothetical protein BWP24_27460 [Vibrio campbellii]ARR10383.1 hypothetical protein Vc3S01_p30041 [Vibrio campbellii]
MFDASMSIFVEFEGSKRQIIYGNEGRAIFSDIFDRHIGVNIPDHENTSSLEQEMISLFLNKIFVQRLDINVNLVKRVCDKISNKLAKKIVNFDIYIPLFFFELLDGEEFKYGPIVIYRNDNIKLTDISKYDESIFQRYNSVAKISLKSISKEFAFKRADQIIMAFMTIAHLRYGLGYKHNTFTYNEAYNLGLTRRFYAVESNLILSEERAVYGTKQIEDWRKSFNCDVGEALESVLSYMSHSLNKDVFALRLFDALVLVRESVNEKYRYNQIPKLVTAIERLISTKGSNDKITSKLQERMKMLFKVIPELSYLESVDFSSIYDQRSRISHGSHSVIEVADRDIMVNLIDVVDNLIQTCTCLYKVNDILFTRVSDKRLDKLFLGLKEYIKEKEVSNS